MNIILACDENYGIGNDLKLPWRLPPDLERFKNLTVGDGNNVVIMGKNTYKSFKKPLPKRLNIVVSQSMFSDEPTLDVIHHNGFIIVKSIKDAVEYAQLYTEMNESGKIWIIGGSELYESVIDLSIRNTLEGNTDCPPLKNIYVTKLDKDFNCNIFLKEKTINLIQKCNWTSSHRGNHHNIGYTFNEFDADVCEAYI